MRDTALARATFFVRRNRNALLAFLILIFVFFAVNGVTLQRFSYFDLRTITGTGGTLALAAMGQTFAILTGGFDLSTGSVISLVNVLVATMMTDNIANQVLVGLAGIAIGGLLGAFNGFFIAYLRMQPIVVTLATLFIVQGIALLIEPTPGGYIAPGFVNILAGTVIPGVLPSALLIIGLAIVLWLLIKNSRFGSALFAIGGDEHAAIAAGVRARGVKFTSYILAGCFYGAAGVFLSAQSGGSDPLVGAPMLLQVFAAVVLGGTSLAGGRGGAIGSVIGAYILMMFVNVLLILDLPSDLATVTEGVVLILAVVFGSLGSKSSVVARAADTARYFTASRPRRKDGAAGSVRTSLRRATGGGTTPPKTAPWMRRHAEALKFALPSYIALLVVFAATWAYLGHIGPGYIRSLLMIAAFLGILAFGQAVVILTGGLDLSIPWTLAFCGVLFASLTDGDNSALIWGVPLILACGTVIGIINGLGVTLLGLPPIVMTIATNGILQGITLLYTQGSPSGFAPSVMKWFATGSLLWLTPTVWFFAVFILLGSFMLTSMRLGRQLYAVGNSVTVAYLSGINVQTTLISAYAISGFCAGLVGILLVGFNGQASLGMGDDYLLPSIAVVVAGGVLITGGRGHYLGVVGGVLLLTALQVLLSGTTLPEAVRGIIYGVVVLGALLALQQRRPG